MAESGRHDKRRITIELSAERVNQIDALKKEWGLRSRGHALERLLDELFRDYHADQGLALTHADQLEQKLQEGELDEQTALVLVANPVKEVVVTETTAKGNNTSQQSHSESRSFVNSHAVSSGGVDLPGFVRRNSEQLRSSMRPRPTEMESPDAELPPMPQLTADHIQAAEDACHNHWLNLYGTPVSEAVLEAAMLWLARDIWPQSDASEGKPFTWTAAVQTMQGIIPQWYETPASFERVMVIAGVLEDPFSIATLEVRIPTLIRRFVHRFRRQRPNTSFQALEHTMTLQGALKLLHLPTGAGERLKLNQIREAYREQALKHHPDAGGTEDTMRRLNEAYQLLKELYRKHPSSDH